MFDSIRVRLTMWYTVVLALVLVLLAGFTYLLYWQNVKASTDSSLSELANAFATTFQAELADTKGPDAVKSAAHEAMLEHRFHGTVFVIRDSSRQVLFSSFDLPATEPGKERLNAEVLRSPSFGEFVEKAANNPGVPQIVRAGRGGFVAIAKSVPGPGGAYTLVVLQSLHAQRELLGDIRRTFYWAVPLALLLASIGGYFLARKSLSPVVAMASQARNMGAASLRERLVVANPRDELGQLAQAFNELLAGLEASFEQQRRFVADASHELRTPVAILRGETEVTLSREDRSQQEYRETLAILRDESQRLAHIIEDLFTLTRADAGQYPLTMRECYLDELVAQALVRARSLALKKGITLTSAIEADLAMCGDEGLLERLLLNLLDNAIKYSPAESTVQVACRRDDGKYVVSVSDNGPGIPVELQSRIFERFFRADKARSRGEGDTGGAGLGLAIARWIAEAHHGKLELTRSDSSGSTFSVVLPSMQAAEKAKA
jgi:two-component system, OmpR family, sensor kinase